MTATLITQAPAGSDEWHAARRTGIGGSDIAAILGLSKWTSPYTLWAQKVGNLLPGESSEAMEWGNRLEPVILAKFQEEHPNLKITADVGTWRNDEHPWMIANPDALYETEGGQLGVIEIKCAMFENEWREGVPRYYEAQVQWYLKVLGLHHAYVVVLFHGNKYAEYQIEANIFEQQLAVTEAAEFMKYVEAYEPPDFDGSHSTYETVRALHPDIEETEVDVSHLYDKYLECVQLAERANTLVTRMKSVILAVMQKAKYATVDGAIVFTRQARNGGIPYLVAKKQ